MKVIRFGSAGLAMLAWVCASTGLAGTKSAPDFTLTDIAGKPHALADYKGKYVVLEWTNPECPFVKKQYGSGKMQELQKQYTARGVIWLTINSSAEGKQGHYSPEQWVKIQADRKAAPTAMLLDPQGTVGHAYGAKTTPHMFVINPDGQLIYEGAIDNKPTWKPEDAPGAHNYVAAALDEAMAGKPVETPATAPYGCSVKY